MYSACLIGCGYWGNNLYRNFQNSDFFIVSKIVDTNNSILTSIKKKNPLVQTYKDYKKAIKEDNVDLVVVSTPTISHFKISKYALENSKHVLIEKPICLSLKQVKILNKIAKKNKKLIFVDYPFLFSGSISYLKKVIDKWMISTQHKPRILWGELEYFPNQILKPHIGEKIPGWKIQIKLEEGLKSTLK